MVLRLTLSSCATSLALRRSLSSERFLSDSFSAIGVGPVGSLGLGHSLVSAPAPRQRLFFEFPTMVQDAFPSAAVYLIQRHVAKGLVVPFGVVPRDDSVVDPCPADRPNETCRASTKFFPRPFLFGIC